MSACPDRIARPPRATTTSTTGRRSTLDSFATIRREASLDQPARRRREASRYGWSTAPARSTWSATWSSTRGWCRAARTALASRGADPHRRPHGRLGRHRAPGCPRDNEVRLPAPRRAGAGPRPRVGHHPLRGRASRCGRPRSTARWWRSATPRPRCSTCWRCCSTARPGRPRSSAARSGSSAPPSPRRRSASFAADHGIDIPFLTVRGRRGGSAMAASALNALAQERGMTPAGSTASGSAPATPSWSPSRRPG